MGQELRSHTTVLYQGWWWLGEDFRHVQQRHLHLSLPFTGNGEKWAWCLSSYDQKKKKKIVPFLSVGYRQNLWWQTQTQTFCRQAFFTLSLMRMGRSGVDDRGGEYWRASSKIGLRYFVFLRLPRWWTLECVQTYGLDQMQILPQSHLFQACDIFCYLWGNPVSPAGFPEHRAESSDRARVVSSTCLVL